VCNRATLDVHDVRRETEFLHDRKRYGSKGLVDFNTLDIAIAPARSRQRQFDGGDRTEAKQTRLDRGDAVRYESCDGRQTTLICPSLARQYHRRRGGIQPRGVAGGNRAAVAEDRLQLTQRFERGVRPVMLIRLERARSLPSRNFNGYDFVREFSGGLRVGEAFM
jgi:hypothetical protein